MYWYSLIIIAILGDGVQNAFEYSNNILTLSFHKYSYGFFPNSGSIDDVGSSKGKFYSINVPLKDGVCDETYIDIFKELFPLYVFNVVIHILKF